VVMIIAFTIGIWWYFVLLKCKLGRLSMFLTPLALMRMLAACLRYGKHYEPAARTVLPRCCSQTSSGSCPRA